VAVMQTALSTSLSQLLIPVMLSNTDYDQYVADIQSIATNFEAHQDFRQLVGSSKHFYTNNSSSSSSSTKVYIKENCTQETDGQGDIVMTDVAALRTQLAQISALLAQAGLSNRIQEADQRPSAKWLSRKEFANLIQADNCVRCKGKRHVSMSQCKYKQAVRPDIQVSAVKAFSTDSPLTEKGSNNNASDSEN
jgi:hypothetical protein